MENNWIDWNGGECPVERGTLVDVKHRSGQIFTDQPAQVRGYSTNPKVGYAEEWSNDECDSDIIAYRLSEDRA